MPETRLVARLIVYEGEPALVDRFLAEKAVRDGVYNWYPGTVTIVTLDDPTTTVVLQEASTALAQLSVGVGHGNRPALNEEETPDA